MLCVLVAVVVGEELFVVLLGEVRDLPLHLQILPH